MPALSIIIPTLNEADNLARLLPGVTAACPQAEFIVVDGGSTDGTLDALRLLPAVRAIEAPRGRARQMNAGARLAAGEVLLFLHADTSLPLGAQTAILAALDDPGVAGGRFDVRFDNPRASLRMVARLMNLRSRLSGIATGDQAIFVRRDVFERMGGYADIPLMEDIEFTRRLKREGRQACLRLHVTTAARKWEREGVARTILLMWALRFLYVAGISPARLHRYYYGAPPPPDTPLAR
jgi:rSAM/selenodomain-associated transferase 2